MQKNKTKAQKNPLGGFLGYLISIAISVIAVIYLGYHFINSFASDITTEYALLATENDVMEFDAYIMRNETVIYSEKSGGVSYNYSDGTKVAANTDIASIYGSVSGKNTATHDQIIEIDHKIDLLRESNDAGGLAMADASAIDTRIESYYMNIRQSVEQGDYRNLPSRRDDFLTLLNKRQVITGKIDSFDSVIEDLTSMRDMLTSELDDVTETVKSPATGFFYSTTDGYETLFTADAARDMSIPLFDQIMSSEPDGYSENAIGKVATDFEWFIITETTRSELRHYNEGYYYDIIFPYNSDIMLNMKLSDVVAPDGSQRILLIFSTRELPENFSFRRMQTIKIVRSSYTGYKVPISAVRLVDGKMGVYVLVGNVVDFKHIDVTLELDGYYIVAPQDPKNDEEYFNKLGLYDVIITGGKELYVGKMIS